MIAHCTTSKEITWTLVNVRAFYVASKNGHKVSLSWDYTLNCPGGCEVGKRCVPSGGTGRTTLEYNLKKVRNRNLKPWKKAALKACYQLSVSGFLDCAEAMNIGHWGLVDAAYLTKEPTMSPGSCRCIGENRVAYDTDGDPISHIDFKRDQKSEEEFWKRFIAIGQYSIDW